MNIPDDTVLSIGFAAELLGMPMHNVRDLIDRGKIAGHRSLGGQRRVTAGAIDAYLKSQQS